jgi:uncharacterized protein involved in exopolysaccharide biosynthesis
VAPRSAALGFLSRFRISQGDKRGSILTLSLQDASRQRARDVLNTLVDQYNKQAIRDKNQVAVNNANFINERIAIIEEELGDVEGALARFKSQHQVMSVDEAATKYLNESRQSNAAVVRVETQIRLAEYLMDFLNDKSKENEPIPVNTGVDERAITEAITTYNNMKVRRDKLIEASSAESPVVKEMDASLRLQRQNIVGYMENLIAGYYVERNDLVNQENTALNQFSMMPII